VKWCVVVGGGAGVVVVGFGVVVVGFGVVVVSLGMRTTWLSVESWIWVGTNECWAGGVALDVDTVASVARTVDSTTPAPARMISDRERDGPPLGGATSTGPSTGSVGSVGSVTALSPG
jgi:hypothetical protein